jgi:CheY-like chemotaxis protein
MMPATLTPPAVTPAALTQAGRFCVLVVEDDPQVRTFLCAVLHAHGATVETAADGWEAVEAVRARPGHFALALLDVEMPRLDGLATLPALRALDPDLRCVYVTSRQDLGREALLRRGASDVLFKPFRLHDMREILAAVA